MKKKIILGLLFVVLLYSAGGVAYNLLLKKDEDETKSISKIKGYPYVLDSKATPLLKDEFKILKDNLETKEIDKKEYASSIAKLFFIDLYTISNKTSKYDVPTQYVYPDIVDNYKLNVVNTLYKYVENNNKKNTDLPLVTSVLIEDVKEIEFEIDKEVYNGYEFQIKVEYEKQIGYDDKASIIVIEKNNLYYVAEFKSA